MRHDVFMISLFWDKTALFWGLDKAPLKHFAVMMMMVDLTEVFAFRHECAEDVWTPLEIDTTQFSARGDLVQSVPAIDYTKSGRNTAVQSHRHCDTNTRSKVVERFQISRLE
jgi:hypothetical protein